MSGILEITCDVPSVGDMTILYGACMPKYLYPSHSHRFKIMQRGACATTNRQGWCLLF